jgi:ATP-dependent helicase/nuclease subunit A
LQPKKAEREMAEQRAAIAEPAWLRAPAPIEARPPRPLAPSAPVEDDVPYPPPTPAMRAAAERGRWLHRLFERLPDIPSARRQEAADRWLVQQGVDDQAIRHDVIDQALRVIEAPAFADLFGPDALAEAPIAAVVGEAVIAGTVDRLCIGADRIQLIDFKTGRIAPRSPDEVPIAHVRQMAAYVAALEVIFPSRAIEAGLLYTSGPHLVVMPSRLLTAHKPGFAPTQENLPLWPVEPDARPS